MTIQIERGVPKTFTPKQVGEILNVSRSQVYVLMKSGELPSVSIRGCRRITEGQIISYIRSLEK